MNKIYFDYIINIINQIQKVQLEKQTDTNIKNIINNEYEEIKFGLEWALKPYRNTSN